MMTVDLRDGHEFPRSGRQRYGRAMWFLRVSDKARACAAGLLGEYVYPCPIDLGIMERWGIEPSQFDRAIAQHANDRTLFAWLRRRVSNEAIAHANDWLIETKTENLDRQDTEEFHAPRPVCVNCGVAYAPRIPTPQACPICQDERVTAPAVQRWSSVPHVTAAHACEIRTYEPELLAGIALTPSFGIGQRAMLVELPGGCILWDCISAVDDAAVAYIEARGGLAAIALSHPHFYGAMAQWSEAFGGTPAYVHEADRDWVVDPPGNLQLWTGDVLEIAPSITLVRAGGHFDGATVMHVPQAAGGRGALLTGDTIMVTQYADGVSFMRSYATHVPLDAPAIEHLRTVLEPFAFDAIYGAWWDRVIQEGGASLVARAAERYLDIVTA